MNALIRKLQNFTSFDREELQALEELVGAPIRIGRDRDVISQGDNPTGVNLLLEGFAFRYKTLPDGRRQILGFFVPGDICDVRVFVLKHMDHSIATLTDSLVSIMPGDRVLAVTDTYPKIARALAWATLVEESTSREWLLSMGQRSAGERLAHIFCEIFYRMDAVGLATGRSFAFPVTQPELGEATGLSVVHLNRTLQELRRRDLVRFGGRVLTILDLAGLEALALFDPAYLHLHEAASRPSATLEDA